MDRLAPVLLFVCAALGGTGVAQTSDAPFHLDIAPARVVITPSVILVKRECGKSELGCTIFRGGTLRCECRREQKWSMRATAMFVPYVYASSSIFLRHERLHIADLTSRIEAYGRHLTSAEYESQDECRDAARAEEAVFDARLRHFARVSVESLR